MCRYTHICVLSYTEGIFSASHYEAEFLLDVTVISANQIPGLYP